MEKKVTFVTNNAINSPDTIRSKLQDQKFDSTIEIVTPVNAISAYLKSIKFCKSVFVLASEEFKQEMRKEGFNLIVDPVSRL